MNLKKFFGRSSNADAAASITRPAVGVAKVTTVKPGDGAAIPARKPSKHSALLLIEDDFLHRQLDEVFAADRVEWRVERAASVACANQLLAREKFSIVISQSTVQNQSGVDFLNDLHTRLPNTLRFFYGDPPKSADLKRLVGIRPSMISSKTRHEMVLAQLERELLVQSWLTNKEVRQRISAFRKLPSISSIYNQVIAELDSPSGSFDKVASLIAQDPLMTAKILQVVNSAFFALSSAVTKPEEAVLILGAERTKALVLAVPVFTRLDSNACPGLSPDGIWQHSMEVATLARLVALSEKCSVSDANAAFTAGLLHDVGKLLLAVNLSEDYGRVLKHAEELGISVILAEQKKLGATHAEVAACLFGTWGLPVPVLEAVAHHHQPTRSENSKFTPLTAVHVANALFYERRQSKECVLDQVYIRRIGLLDHRNKWRTACGIAPREKDATVGDKAMIRQDARIN